MPKEPSSPRTPKTADSKKHEHRRTLETPKRDDRRRRLLNRWERALCRVLDRYGVDQDDLAGYLQCAASTVTRAVKNSYTDPDTHLEKDGEILQSDAARFNVALEKLVPVQVPSERKGKRVHPIASGAQEIHPQLIKASSSQHIDDKSHPKLGKSGPCTENKASGHSASSIATKTEPAGTDAEASDDPELALFILAVPLDARWYMEVKQAGFTMEKLRRLAGIAREDVERLIGKRFPKMDDLDRLLFVTAIKAPTNTTR
ncbi:hypothetical protein C8R47DRAFT_1167597 [Mycena vitilis]|nr:hypothetical protein C8R47DRAFT_1167597 [Mycena vitilis]